MVARLTYAKNYARKLNYNEQKVRKGEAAFIHAENFLIDKNRLTISDKHDRFKSLSDLNPRIRKNALHAKLIFHPDESLSDDMLARISDRYMRLIGYGDQPYLVYRHYDAGEPHIHIVSSLIKDNGKRIESEEQPWAMSVRAARSIEIEWGLKRVEEHRRTKSRKLKAQQVCKVKYGEKRLIESIENAITMAMNEYKASSMREFNALLRLYNIYADRCKPGSHTFAHGGLYYRVLDKDGKNRCTPFKASTFDTKPTLNNLEKKFQENRNAIAEYIPYIKSRIDWILLQCPGSLEQFDQDLKAEGIDMVVSKVENNIGLVFIDHKSRIAIDGEEIGRSYTGEEMLVRFPELSRQELSARINKHRVPDLLSDVLDHHESKNLHHSQQKEIHIKKRF